MEGQDEINQVIIHEFIHAYDDCVGKNMDWKNCAHHACSEVTKILSVQSEALVLLFEPSSCASLTICVFLS
jgi:hypothetical protein